MTTAQRVRVRAEDGVRINPRKHGPESLSMYALNDHQSTPIKHIVIRMKGGSCPRASYRPIDAWPD
jgi:hypothetical protein